MAYVYIVFVCVRLCVSPNRRELLVYVGQICPAGACVSCATFHAVSSVRVCCVFLVPCTSERTQSLHKRHQRRYTVCATCLSHCWSNTSVCKKMRVIPMVISTGWNAGRFFVFRRRFQIPGELYFPIYSYFAFGFSIVHRRRRMQWVLR